MVGFWANDKNNYSTVHSHFFTFKVIELTLWQLASLYSNCIISGSKKLQVVLRTFKWF